MPEYYEVNPRWIPRSQFFHCFQEVFHHEYESIQFDDGDRQKQSGTGHHVCKRPGDGAIRTVVKKLNLANVRFDSASAINTSGLVFSEGIALNALSCGGFV